MTDAGALPGSAVRVLPWSDVTARAGLASTVVIATPRAAAVLAPLWPSARFVREADTASAARVRDPDNAEPSATRGREPDTVIVVGGGTLIDDIKRRWRTHWPSAELIAVPTIWGSGAESSPVAVWTDDGKKQFALTETLRPTWAAFYPPFASTISPARALAACGDVWSHAIEGFLSPLADIALRARFAALINRLVELPLAPDARWFPIGADAAALQARASVGLVHGLAHVLEPVCGDGHARLCALLLGPVLRWNASTSTKWGELCEAHGLDRSQIEAIVDGLGEREARRALVPAIEASWRTVLRDPCTRTNSALVRPDSLAGVIAELVA